MNLNDAHRHLIRNRENALKPMIQVLHKLKPGQSAVPVLRKLEKYYNEINDESMEFHIPEEDIICQSLEFSTEFEFFILFSVLSGVTA